jgi:hypothetical protein
MAKQGTGARSSGGAAALPPRRIDRKAAGDLRLHRREPTFARAGCSTISRAPVTAVPLSTRYADQAEET